MAKAEASARSSSLPSTGQQKDVATGSPGLPGDIIAGRQVFKRYQACHLLEPGKTILGPSLAGIVGHKSAADANFSYSPAMKQATLTWDAGTLNAYLMEPQKVVPGNWMPFPGLRTDQDRKDVIAFLAAPAVGAPPVAASAAAAPQARSANDVAYFTDTKFTLRTGIAEGKMVFVGVGGSIDGIANPVLTAAEGQIVQLTLINGEGTEHGIVSPDQNAKSPRVNGNGASTPSCFGRRSPEISSISAAFPVTNWLARLSIDNAAFQPAERALEQFDARPMQPITGRGGGEACAGPRVGAFQDQPQLVAAEHAVPGQL